MTTLSHYTSLTGLEGIAKTGTLWATNFTELNDTSEYFYAWEILQRDAIDYIMARIPSDLKRPDADLDGYPLGHQFHGAERYIGVLLRLGDSTTRRDRLYHGAYSKRSEAPRCKSRCSYESNDRSVSKRAKVIQWLWTPVHVIVCASKDRRSRAPRYLDLMGALYET